MGKNTNPGEGLFMGEKGGGGGGGESVWVNNNSTFQQSNLSRISCFSGGYR